MTSSEGRMLKTMIHGVHSSPKKGQMNGNRVHSPQKQNPLSPAGKQLGPLSVSGGKRPTPDLDLPQSKRQCTPGRAVDTRTNKSHLLQTLESLETRQKQVETQCNELKFEIQILKAKINSSN